jgi:hypothetical protein
MLIVVKGERTDAEAEFAHRKIRAQFSHVGIFKETFWHVDGQKDKIIRWFCEPSQPELPVGSLLYYNGD